MEIALDIGEEIIQGTIKHLERQRSLRGVEFREEREFWLDARNGKFGFY